jgi:DNA-binding transcriptional LysR family regulator
MPETSTTSALSHLKLRHLRLIDLLVEHGTLRRAAAMLHITQPAATGMLNDIEALFGISLFARSHQGVRLTDAGTRLLAPLTTLLNEFEALEHRVAEARLGCPRSLRIGALPHVFAHLLPLVVERLGPDPGMVLQLTDGLSPGLLELLLAGKLDCVVGRLPPEFVPRGTGEQLEFVRLYDEQVVFVCAPDNAIARKRGLDYRDLSMQSWALPSYESSTRRAFAETFLRNGFSPPEPKVETGSFLYNLELVSASSMLTIAPRVVSEKHAKRGLLTVLKVPVKATPMEVCFIARKNSAQDSMLARFRDAVIASTNGERWRSAS